MIRVSIIGSKGYGVLYGGFETFVKNLIDRSDKNRFFYYCYGRGAYRAKSTSEKNFSSIKIPSVFQKHLEPFLYSVLSNIDCLFKKVDIVFYLAPAHANLIFLHKLLGRAIVVNMDGLDWKRKRWHLLGKAYLKLCERLVVVFADIIICDSRVILNYCKEKYHKNNFVYIPYGSEVKVRQSGQLMNKLGLNPSRYLLFVGRLVPENNIEELLLAFNSIDTDYQCVILGDSTFEDEYKKYLKVLASENGRVIFTGFIGGKEYEEVCSNAFAYIETKGVGGTHPSLLEAMRFKNCIIAKNIPEHIEVIGDAGLYYDKDKGHDDLAKVLQYLLNNPKEAVSLSKRAGKRVSKFYQWESVIKSYEKIFINLRKTEVTEKVHLDK